MFLLEPCRDSNYMSSKTERLLGYRDYCAKPSWNRINRTIHTWTAARGLNGLYFSTWTFPSIYYIGLLDESHPGRCSEWSGLFKDDRLTLAVELIHLHWVCFYLMPVHWMNPFVLKRCVIYSKVKCFLAPCWQRLILRRNCALSAPKKPGILQRIKADSSQMPLSEWK